MIHFHKFYWFWELGMAQYQNLSLYKVMGNCEHKNVRNLKPPERKKLRFGMQVYITIPHHLCDFEAKLCCTSLLSLLP